MKLEKRNDKFLQLTLWIMLVPFLITTLLATKASSAQLDKTGTQWAPFIEWSIENPGFTENPFDLVATVTFVHTSSGETHTTEMFYDGGSTWKFRFTGTQIGTWTFTTSSSDADLNGNSGTVTINTNPDTGSKGFITSSCNYSQ